MVQSLASRLRLWLPCAWALESVKKRTAVTLSRVRKLHAQGRERVRRDTLFAHLSGRKPRRMHQVRQRD